MSKVYDRIDRRRRKRRKRKREAYPCLLYDNAIFSPTLTRSLHRWGRRYNTDCSICKLIKKGKMSPRHIKPKRVLLINQQIKRLVIDPLTCNLQKG